MISRVASNCFWLNRYIERIDALARFIEVNQAFVLDAQLPAPARWKPLVIVVGEELTFDRLHRAKSAAEDADLVQDFLTWDERNPSAMANALAAARENARTVRETVSLEVWRAVNEMWLWFNGKEAKTLYRRNRPDFYRQITERCQHYHGVSLHTMLYDEALQFMRMGSALERANQIARIVDVKYHSLGPTRSEEETPLETAQWLAILRSCLGVEPYFKRGADILSGPGVASFLLSDRAFPHSVHHNLLRAREHLGSIRRDRPAKLGARSTDLLDKLLSEIAKLVGDTLLKRTIHAVMTEVVDQIGVICMALHEDFFNPVRPPESRGRRRKAG